MRHRSRRRQDVPAQIEIGHYGMPDNGLDIALLRAVFETANAQGRRPLFTIRPLQGGVFSGDMSRLDACFIGGPDILGATAPTAIRNAYDLRRRSAMLIGIGFGAFTLTAARLTDGAATAVHRKDLPKFRELFPFSRYSTALIEWGDRLATCAGGMATTEAALMIVEKLAGRALAGDVAGSLLYHRNRFTLTGQTLAVPEPSAGKGDIMARLAELLRDHVETPLATEDLADRLSVSIRTLQRLVRRRLDCTLMAYYRQIRLEHANWMLRETSNSISAIAASTGFPSHSNFTRQYRTAYGVSPSAVRRRARVQSAKPRPSLPTQAVQALR
ncbi:GlxA family transcriptional regulator [Pacificispira sp.]|uniref:GlxA family transcriptional regulator n=1 Tax=Pacificispira sp. TaxID=2888761 RepID=UPI003B52352D